MQQHLGFLNASSAVVKVAAWIFLFFGCVGGVSMMLGFVTQYPRWMGIIVLAMYAFLFFFLILIAKIADVLVKIINRIDTKE